MVSDLPRLCHPGRLTAHCGGSAAPEGAPWAGARRAFLELDPEAVTALVDESALQVRGRWSSRVADEWRALSSAGARPGAVVCHGGLVGPGSAADRLLVERAPELVLAGVLTAARAIGASLAHVCLAEDHAAGAGAMTAALEAARAAGHVGDAAFGSGEAVAVELAQPPAFTPCGGGTALLEVLAGRVARPRPRPPLPSARGLGGTPTWIADAETCAQLALTVANGADWLLAQGEPDAPGTAIFEVRGHVERPGLYELPLGTRLSALVFEHAGGVAGGRKVGAVLPGGLSAGALSPGGLDVPLTDAALREQGSALGRGEVVVVDDAHCMVGTALSIGARFRELACGHAVHCREGALLVREILGRVLAGRAGQADLVLLHELCDEMLSGTHCGLADGVAPSVRSLALLFRDDFESHVLGEGCGRAGEVRLS